MSILLFQLLKFQGGPTQILAGQPTPTPPYLLRAYMNLWFPSKRPTIKPLFVGGVR